MSLAKTIESGMPKKHNGIPSQGDLNIINEGLATPLSAEDVYVFATIMANREKSVDNRRLAFTDKTLSNIAKQAKSGVPLLLSHNRESGFAPSGYTYHGYFDSTTGESRAVAYIVKGMKLPDNYTSDDEIKALASGTRRSVSVSVGGGELLCGMCDKSFLECDHSGDEKDWHCKLEGANLRELSLVDVGAMGGAKINQFAIADNPKCEYSLSADIQSQLPEKMEKFKMNFNPAKLFSSMGLFRTAGATLSEESAEFIETEAKKELEELISKDSRVAYLQGLGVTSLAELKELVNMAELGKKSVAGVDSQLELAAKRLHGEDYSLYIQGFVSAPVDVKLKAVEMWNKSADTKFGLGETRVSKEPINTSEFTDLQTRIANTELALKLAYPKGDYPDGLRDVKNLNAMKLKLESIGGNK